MSNHEHVVANCENNNQVLRKNGLDCLKIICAFLVVCIHIPFPEMIGIYIKAWARIAVPIFFIISGYFYEQTKCRGRCKPQLVKIIKLLLCSMLLYSIFYGAIAIAKGEFVSFLKNDFGIGAIINFWMLNSVTVSEHLWYLAAIAYVLVAITVFDKFFARKALYPLIPVLLLVDLVFGKYSLVLLGREFPYILVRNWLFVGLPYFLIGDMLREKKIQSSGKKLWSYVPIFMELRY